MISANVLFFWISILFVFWLGSLTAKKVPAESKAGIPGSVPQPAASH
jgi:cytochrome bd ubiquinol oxidase subunit I